MLFPGGVLAGVADCDLKERFSDTHPRRVTGGLK